MKVSREQVAEHRQQILEAASRLFRERGYDGVTVAEIMGAAGLTHGGFYGHFASKDDLIAHTLAYLSPHQPPAGADRPAEADLATYRAGYLSPSHRDDRAGGCPVAALGGETVRQSPEARAAMTDSLRRQLARFAATAPGGDAAARRRAAIGNWAAMVGAVILARLSDDPALSDEVLQQTRAWLEAPAAGAPAAKATTKAAAKATTKVAAKATTGKSAGRARPRRTPA
ncbi:MAG TPA: helix-turn-helix domain-containing protein [Kofleriaceae bacterium]|nr:helix-turn-helix domain-containing protein [Kofleriaceae bacterium]